MLQDILAEEIQPILSENPYVAADVASLPVGLSAVFHALPDNLHQQRLLRIQMRGLVPCYLEHRGVDLIDVVLRQEVAALRTHHAGFVGRVEGRDIVAIGGDGGRSVGLVHEKGPEGRRAIRVAGEAQRHADNGDRWEGTFIV